MPRLFPSICSANFFAVLGIRITVLAASIIGQRWVGFNLTGSTLSAAAPKFSIRERVFEFAAVCPVIELLEVTGRASLVTDFDRCQPQLVDVGNDGLRHPHRSERGVQTSLPQNDLHDHGASTHSVFKRPLQHLSADALKRAVVIDIDIAPQHVVDAKIEPMRDLNAGSSQNGVRLSVGSECAPQAFASVSCEIGSACFPVT